MSDKIITIDDVLGFRIVWETESHWANVTVYEIIGTADNAAPLFNRKDSAFSPDFVYSHTEAEVYLDGFVKWDGCTELNQGTPHWCGAHGYKQHCDLLRYIYDRSFILMGVTPLDTWPT